MVLPFIMEIFMKDNLKIIKLPLNEDRIMNMIVSFEKAIYEGNAIYIYHLVNMLTEYFENFDGEDKSIDVIWSKLHDLRHWIDDWVHSE